MAVNLSISMCRFGGDKPTVATVGTLDDGKQYICLRLDDGMTVILDGVDAVSVAHAREIATALTIAADAIEARDVPAAPVVPAGVTSADETEPF